MKKILIPVIIIALAIIIIFTLVSEALKEDSITEKNITESSESQPAAQKSAVQAEKTLLEKLQENPESQVANLIAVDDSQSSGMAYRLFANGKLMHVVKAVLPDPPEGQSYEGWLVQSSPLKFFSTGVMQKDESGKWFLEYTTDQEFPTYLQVVITLETKVDEIPEKHIIEGDLMNFK